MEKLVDWFLGLSGFGQLLLIIWIGIVVSSIHLVNIKVDK